MEILTSDEKLYWTIAIPWTFLANILYTAYLFRKLPFLSSEISYIVFIAVVCVCVFTERNVISSKSLNMRRFAVSLFRPYILYTALAYSSMYITVFMVVSCLAIVIQTIYSVVLFGRKIRARGIRRKRIIYRRKRQFLILFKRHIFFAGFTFFVIVAISTFVESIPLHAKTEAVNVYKEERNQEFTFENQLEILKRMRQPVWETLSIYEKADVCQTLVNCMVEFFGINHEIPLQIQECDKNLMATYNNDKKVIILNSLFLESGMQTCESIVHEAYHAYSLELVQLYDKASPQERNLLLLRSIAVYADEYENYSSGLNNDIEQYINQECEIDAELVAGIITQYIFELIEESDSMP